MTAPVARPAHVLLSPSRTSVERELWLAAALVAGARKSVNDPIRAHDRDRGLDKNLLNDVQGVIGEIVGGEYIRTTLGVAVADDLLDLTGPTDRVDLVFDDGAGELRLESKCHLLAPNKRYLLINQRAHERSMQRGAHGYLPVVSALGQGGAMIGSVIGVAAARGWGQPLTLPDPAIGTHLRDFCLAHLGMRLNEVESLIEAWPHVAAPDELIEVASRAPADLDPGLSIGDLARLAEGTL